MDPIHATITELNEALAGGNLSSEALTQAYLQRIEQHNKAGAALNAVRELNPKALDIARAMDVERAQGRPRGPLHGIPILLKDNICTGDGMATTVGSIAFADFHAPKDAFVVKQLRQAGAIILGKANLTEFTDVMSDRMASCFSAIAGDVVNPVTREPYGRGGGSSVGPAAAVAAGFCAAAIGSETINSLQDPACTTALVSLKPTVPLISGAGIVPNCLSQDVAGPFTRSVADAALILNAIAGVDFDDPLTLAASGHVEPDYQVGLRDDALAGARIGVAREVYFESLADDEVAVAETAFDALRATGALVLDPVDIPTARVVADIRSSILRNEFKSGIDAWLAALGDQAPVGSLAELIEFNKGDPDTRMPKGQALFEVALEMPGVGDPSYHADRRKDIMLSRQAGIDAAMEAYQLDCLVVPQAQAAKILGKAGYPAVAVPAGYTTGGKPVGLTFFGRAFSEARLLGIAHGFEVSTQARRTPQLD